MRFHFLNPIKNYIYLGIFILWVGRMYILDSD